MSYPNLTFSTPTFAPPVGAATFTVPASAPPAAAQASTSSPGDEALSAIHWTTSGARFRCRINDKENVTRLMCCQCSGDKAHVSEATSLNGSSSDASLPKKGILDLSIKGLDLRLCADARCVERDSPGNIKQYTENAELTQLAQQSVVRCAHNVSDDSECGEWLLLSELPRHHHGTHLAPPRATLAEPQNSSAAIPTGFWFGKPLLATNQPSPAASAPTGQNASERPALTGDFGIDLPHHNGRSRLFEPAPFPAPSRGVEDSRQGIGSKRSGFIMGSGIEFPRQDRPSLFGSPKGWVSELSKDIEGNKKGIDELAKKMDALIVEPPKVPVSKLSKDIEGNKKSIDELTKQIAGLTQKNEQLETLVARLSAEMANLGQQLKLVNAWRQFSPINNGILLWKIPDFKKEMTAARLGTGRESFYSDFFFARSGHLLRARIYPNGDGLGKKTHVSLFLTIHKTENDKDLEWPFNEKVVMSVVGSQGRVLYQDWFAPNSGSSSFQRPVHDQNIASGIPLFMKQEGIDNFLVNGALMLKIAVGDDKTPLPNMVMAQFSESSNPSQSQLYPKLNQMEH